MICTPEIYARIVSAKLFIDNNFGEAIDLEQISKQAFLSRYHFHRLFTQIYRKTPHQYLTIKRLEKAKALLAKEGIKITDVCNVVGFESAASFSILFRKHTGFAPQYYRNIAYLKSKLAKEEPKKCLPFCFVEMYGLSDEKSNY
jgi:AraC-like DNA-binding protein